MAPRVQDFMDVNDSSPLLECSTTTTTTTNGMATEVPPATTGRTTATATATTTTNTELPPAEQPQPQPQPQVVVVLQGEAPPTMLVLGGNPNQDHPSDEEEENNDGPNQPQEEEEEQQERPQHSVVVPFVTRNVALPETENMTAAVTAATTITSSSGEPAPEEETETTDPVPWPFAVTNHRPSTSTTATTPSTTITFPPGTMNLSEHPNNGPSSWPNHNNNNNNNNNNPRRRRQSTTSTTSTTRQRRRRRTTHPRFQSSTTTRGTTTESQPEENMRIVGLAHQHEEESGPTSPPEALWLPSFVPVSTAATTATTTSIPPQSQLHHQSDVFGVHSLHHPPVRSEIADEFIPPRAFPFHNGNHPEDEENEEEDGDSTTTTTTAWLPLLRPLRQLGQQPPRRRQGQVVDVPPGSYDDDNNNNNNDLHHHHPQMRRSLSFPVSTFSSHNNNSHPWEEEHHHHHHHHHSYYHHYHYEEDDYHSLEQEEEEGGGELSWDYHSPPPSSSLGSSIFRTRSAPTVRPQAEEEEPTGNDDGDEEQESLSTSSTYNSADTNDARMIYRSFAFDDENDEEESPAPQLQPEYEFEQEEEVEEQDLMSEDDAVVANPEAVAAASLGDDSFMMSGGGGPTSEEDPEGTQHHHDGTTWAAPLSPPRSNAAHHRPFLLESPPPPPRAPWYSSRRRGDDDIGHDPEEFPIQARHSSRRRPRRRLLLPRPRQQQRVVPLFYPPEQQPHDNSFPQDLPLPSWMCRPSVLSSPPKRFARQQQHPPPPPPRNVGELSLYPPLRLVDEDEEDACGAAAADDDSTTTRIATLEDLQRYMRENQQPRDSRHRRRHGHHHHGCHRSPSVLMTQNISINNKNDIHRKQHVFQLLEYVVQTLMESQSPRFICFGMQLLSDYAQRPYMRTRMPATTTETATTRTTTTTMTMTSQETGTQTHATAATTEPTLPFSYSNTNNSNHHHPESHHHTTYPYYPPLYFHSHENNACPSNTTTNMEEENEEIEEVVIQEEDLPYCFSPVILEWVTQVVLGEENVSTRWSRSGKGPSRHTPPYHPNHRRTTTTTTFRTSLAAEETEWRWWQSLAQEYAVQVIRSLTVYPIMDSYLVLATPHDPNHHQQQQPDGGSALPSRILHALAHVLVTGLEHDDPGSYEQQQQTEMELETTTPDRKDATTSTTADSTSGSCSAVSPTGTYPPPPTFTFLSPPPPIRRGPQDLWFPPSFLSPTPYTTKAVPPTVLLVTPSSAGGGGNTMEHDTMMYTNRNNKHSFGSFQQSSSIHGYSRSLFGSPSASCPQQMFPSSAANGSPSTVVVTEQARIHAAVAIMNLSCGPPNNKVAMAACPPLLFALKMILFGGNPNLLTSTTRTATTTLGYSGDNDSPTVVEMSPATLETLRLKAATTLKNLSNLERNDESLVQFPGLVQALGRAILSSTLQDHVVGANDCTTHACTALMNLSVSKHFKCVVYHTPGVMQALLTVLARTDYIAPSVFSSSVDDPPQCSSGNSDRDNNADPAAQPPSPGKEQLQYPPRHLLLSAYDARVRTCSVLSNLAIGYDNKLSMFHYPGLVDAMVRIVIHSSGDHRRRMMGVLDHEDDTGPDTNYDEELRSKACSILWSLAAEKENQIPMVLGENGQRVVRILIQVANESFPSDSRQKCVAALTLLAEASHNAVPLIQAGLLPPLLHMLQQAGTDPTQWKDPTASWCVSCLMNLAQVPQAVSYLHQAGAVQTLAPLVIQEQQYQSLKAAMAVLLLCYRRRESPTYSRNSTTGSEGCATLEELLQPHRSDYSNDPDYYYTLLRQIESAIPQMIELLYNTLAGRGGDGYKYGVFTMSSAVACIAAVAGGHEFLQEHICGTTVATAVGDCSDDDSSGPTTGSTTRHQDNDSHVSKKVTLPVLVSLLQVLWDFSVDGGISGTIVGGGRDDLESAQWALEATHSIVVYLRNYAPITTANIIPCPSLTKSLLHALQCTQNRFETLGNSFHWYQALAAHTQALIDTNMSIGTMSQQQCHDSNDVAEAQLEDSCSSSSDSGDSVASDSNTPAYNAQQHPNKMMVATPTKKRKQPGAETPSPTSTTANFFFASQNHVPNVSSPVSVIWTRHSRNLSSSSYSTGSSTISRDNRP